MRAAVWARQLHNTPLHVGQRHHVCLLLLLLLLYVTLRAAAGQLPCLTAALHGPVSTCHCPSSLPDLPPALQLLCVRQEPGAQQLHAQPACHVAHPGRHAPVLLRRGCRLSVVNDSRLRVAMPDAGKRAAGKGSDLGRVRSAAHVDSVCTLSYRAWCRTPAWRGMLGRRGLAGDGRVDVQHGDGPFCVFYMRDGVL